MNMEELSLDENYVSLNCHVVPSDLIISSDDSSSDDSDMNDDDMRIFDLINLKVNPYSEFSRFSLAIALQNRFSDFWYLPFSPVFFISGIYHFSPEVIENLFNNFNGINREESKKLLNPKKNIKTEIRTNQVGHTT